MSDGSGLERLGDLTVAVVGYGRIGRDTARKLQAFGCRILAMSPNFATADGVAEPADVSRIQAEADVIILHTPLTAATTKLIDRPFLAGLRRRPLIINVSRGGLVDNAALLEALDRGLLRGAALDVIDGEPSPPAAVYERPDVITTPHVAFASAPPYANCVGGDARRWSARCVANRCATHSTARSSGRRCPAVWRVTSASSMAQTGPKSSSTPSPS